MFRSPKLFKVDIPIKQLPYIAVINLIFHRAHIRLFKYHEITFLP